MFSVSSSNPLQFSFSLLAVPNGKAEAQRRVGGTSSPGKPINKLQKTAILRAPIGADGSSGCVRPVCPKSRVSGRDGQEGHVLDEHIVP